LQPSQIERWSYATAKKLDEFLAFAYAQTYQLPVVITRFFNIVGPRQRARYGMVLPNFIRAALAGEPIRVFGDGMQTRNFCFVEDCVDALLKLLSASTAEGHVFNIGGPEEISMMELAERVKRITASPSPIVKVSYDEAYPEGNFEDMRRRVPCNCGIHRLTGWAPKTSLESIIAQTSAYEQHRANSLRPPTPVAIEQVVPCTCLVM
jgi:UDP-glucose 4-epimerase